jgi:predicted RNA methylase
MSKIANRASVTKKPSKSTAEELDQYYTNPVYAEQFLKQIGEKLDLNSADILLEPSAGAGSFYGQMDLTKSIGLDLDPQYPGVIQTDFFDWIPPTGKKIITIGNPPFGKNANLAVKFFNKSAEFSDAIAFIIPRTFRKASLVNRLNNQFHKIYDELTPPDSFLFNGNPYDVPCVAQIWVRKEEQREKINTIKLTQMKNWFEMVEPNFSDFAIQRVGGRAGQIRLADRMNYAKMSHYFIKSVNPKTLDIFKAVDFNRVKHNTAGNPSISPSELCELFIDTASSRGITVAINPIE